MIPSFLSAREFCRESVAILAFIFIRFELSVVFSLRAGSLPSLSWPCAKEIQI